ncbi:MAG: DUF2470 domain-containing protein [Gammaproteobacteria bacterium]|nr:DUF2470 domain-containing protein [Gammaproteobacteria bacterium]
MSKWPKELQTPLCDYMNEAQAEALLSLVKKQGDQKDALKAQMVGIDADGVRVVAYTMHGEERLVIPFKPSLTHYEEARERLLALATQ